MGDAVRWGVLGTGGIAGKFAGQLVAARGAALHAVGSRSGESAERFAALYGGAAHGSYQGVLDDPDVEAVYIALPNDLHQPWTVAALGAGKHVLCEKPLAWAEGAARRMFDAAERADRVLVEAFMYRLHPGIAKLVELVRGGTIGRVKLIRTGFTFHRPASRADGRYHFEQGGGALLDVGCYCVHLARELAGSEPTDVAVYGHRHELGVDDHAAGLLRFGDGVLAHFGCGMTVQADRGTAVLGEEGAVELADTWFDPSALVLTRGETSETIRAPATLPPYALEADAFGRVVRGEAEPWITPADSIAQARVLGELRERFAADVDGARA